MFSTNTASATLLKLDVLSPVGDPQKTALPHRSPFSVTSYAPAARSQRKKQAFTTRRPAVATSGQGTEVLQARGLLRVPLRARVTGPRQLFEQHDSVGTANSPPSLLGLQPRIDRLAHWCCMRLQRCTLAGEGRGAAGSCSRLPAPAGISEDTAEPGSPQSQKSQSATHLPFLLGVAENEGNASATSKCKAALSHIYQSRTRPLF